jgi:hypothetical protein
MNGESTERLCAACTPYEVLVPDAKVERGELARPASLEWDEKLLIPHGSKGSLQHMSFADMLLRPFHGNIRVRGVGV